MSELNTPVDFTDYKLGESYPPISINTSKANTQVSLNMLSQARVNIDLFTHDLDPRILNNNDIANCIIQFIKISSHSRFRILLSDPATVIKRGHYLLELANRFPSFISIRKTNDDYRTTAFSLLMIDQKALIYRPDANQYQAVVNYNARYECRQHLEFFNSVWNISEVASEMRQLHI